MIHAYVDVFQGYPNFQAMWLSLTSEILGAEKLSELPGSF